MISPDHCERLLDADAPRCFTRREVLRHGLVFSASLMLPRLLQTAGAALPASPEALNLFCFGDWGSHADAPQRAVAKAMQDYARGLALTPQAFILLGDNFYGPLSGTDSPRWKVEFEEMYPAGDFPGPCYAILGNHDYDDQPDGEKIQIAYASTPNTRWKMPDRWYRLDLPASNPVATLLCVNTHYAKLSNGDISAQQHWLEEQLAAPRTSRWLFVCGHHPVLSCGLHHGGTPTLQRWRELFYRHNVTAYLCGHEHDLQHLREDGQTTDWLVSGGGGKALHQLAKTAQTQFAEPAFGFLHLAVGSDRMTATFAGTDASPLHAFTRSA